MRKWIAIILTLILFSCSSQKENVSVSFYYWRTSFDLTPTEKLYLKELEIKKIYVRYFDVALKDSQAIPNSPIIFKQNPENLEIVPVVYIKNEIFTKNDTDSLPAKIYNYIQQINKSKGISINEIQFDCDWSVTTKQQYFKFLEDFKKLFPNLSATIRLHQVKYPEKTGTPNLKNGVLMYYNMGVIGPDKRNSIYDREVASRYIQSLQHYTLPLKVALPIFSWGVQIRKHKVTNLIGGLRNTDLTEENFKKVQTNRYKVLKDFVYKGRFLAKDDEIKIEEISDNQLKEMIKDIKKYIKTKPKEIILYDLNEQNIIHYEKQTFKNIKYW